MRLGDILKNLTDYHDPSLIEHTWKDTKYKMDERFLDSIPSAFVALSFGAGTGYNGLLARSIVDADTYFEVRPPVFAEKQITEGFLYTRDWVHEFGERREIGERSLVFSKTKTYEIMEEIKDKMDKKGINKKNISYFAHPAHIYRAMEIGKKFGIEGGPFMIKEVLWPKADDQWWVRGPRRYAAREFLTRVHHLAKGLV